MNRVLLQLLSFMFCVCISCSDDDTIVSASPFELPSYCNPVIDEEKIVLIDNETDFKQVFANYPSLKPIDFRHMKLLLVKDTARQGIENIEKQLLKTKSVYELTVTVRLTAATVMEPWCIAYAIPKEIDMEDIKLTIDYIEYKENR